MEQQRFSWKKRGNSFQFAWNGIRAVLRTEHNTWIHLALTLAVVTGGIGFRIGRQEWIVLILAMAFVWVTEILNTAIEKAMDFISMERHPMIRLVKDLAAAAVLIASLAALIIGCLIFIPKLF
ncbi:MAG TPA: diacylglycerol kinase family protein [Flavisolibacter sp.]|jgi:diacylglycerol kinase|nr:diacylglycerol kinase family protein [Flavisolibacter sp.]